jgi:hypothetical protein
MLDLTNLPADNQPAVEVVLESQPTPASKSAFAPSEAALETDGVAAVAAEPGTATDAAADAETAARTASADITVALAAPDAAAPDALPPPAAAP